MRTQLLLLTMLMLTVAAADQHRGDIAGSYHLAAAPPPSIALPQENFSFSGAYVVAAIVFGISFVASIALSLVEAAGFLSSKMNTILGISMQAFIVILAISLVGISTSNYNKGTGLMGVMPCNLNPADMQLYKPQPQPLVVPAFLLFISTFLFAVLLVFAWAVNSMAQYYNSPSKNLVMLLQFFFFAIR